MIDVMNDAGYKTYRKERIEHWDKTGAAPLPPHYLGGHYHRRLEKIYRSLIPPGQKIMEIGCGYGDLLKSLEPSDGLGVDFSEKMFEVASRRHPELRFVLSDFYEMMPEEKFDYIILSDVVNELWDVEAAFRKLKGFCTPRTRILINTYSRVWEHPLALGRKLGLGRPALTQNWLTTEDLANLLRLADFEVIRAWPEILWPGPPRFLADFLNRYLAKVLPFKWFDLQNFLAARPAPPAGIPEREPKVSVVVPARNESGNIEAIFQRTPEMGAGTQLIFVEGGSSDDTYQAVEEAIARHPEREAVLFRQTGVGKGDAVRLGYAHSNGDILMILDADMTVPPEDLPRFYQALRRNKGEFVNGVRLVYPMEKEAMRFFNLLGNKFFSLTFSWLLGQPVKDTLCGTKVLWKEDYDRLAAGRSYFGDFDPFGDFDLLFGAARLNLKIVEIPIRYRQRLYGSTNIDRWRHGWLLIKMSLFAMKRIKFI